MDQYILVLDYGSQYTQLIARRIRECNVYSEVKPYTFNPKELSGEKPIGIILSGGPCGVSDEDAPHLDRAWLEMGVPLLGICYGMQVLAHTLEGEVTQGKSREYGQAEITVNNPSDLFKGFDKREKSLVWMSHGDHVVELPVGFITLASSAGAPIAACADLDRKLYGIQFHPEVVHTPRGKEILSNFLFEICGCQKNWSSSNFITDSIAHIKEVAADGNVICGLSGGVDSSVAACLVNEAIGERLHCVLVDNGLMRMHEAEQIVNRLGKTPGGLGLNLTVVDASEKFLRELEGVTDPEQKRKIIGRVFIEVFEEEAKRIKDVRYLVQGTLYPDVIESVSVKGPSDTIKTHHNVGGLPEKMNLKLIEPFRELFKDEVRAIGRELGIPEDIIGRHPFPGPGLGVRVLGEISEDKLDILRKADQIFIEELHAANLYKSIWQAFVVLLPVQSVGVMGDNRTYEQVAALRAVTSEDGMTADWFAFPEEVLKRVSRRIINEVKGINRVVLDISSKPPATIEWE